MQPVRIEYRFELPGQEATCFVLDFDDATMVPLTPVRKPSPFWAQLDFHRCPHCPLNAGQVPDCPAAARLADLLAWCAGLVSHQSLRLTVVTPERATVADTSAQRAVTSPLHCCGGRGGAGHARPRQLDPFADVCIDDA